MRARRRSRPNWRVVRIASGDFIGTGPMYGGAKFQSGRWRWSPTRTSGVSAVLAAKRIQAIDQEMFRHVGVEPSEVPILALKSTVHFRADFQPIAETVLCVVVARRACQRPGRDALRASASGHSAAPARAGWTNDPPRLACRRVRAVLCRRRGGAEPGRSGAFIRAIYASYERDKLAAWFDRTDSARLRQLIDADQKARRRPATPASSTGTGSSTRRTGSSPTSRWRWYRKPSTVPWLTPRSTSSARIRRCGDLVRENGKWTIDAIAAVNKPRWSRSNSSRARPTPSPTRRLNDCGLYRT